MQGPVYAVINLSGEKEKVEVKVEVKESQGTMD